MPWPFSSTSSPSDKSDEQKRGSSANDSRSWGDLLPAPDTPLTAAARDWAPVILAGVGSLAAFVLYQSYLRRFPGASHVQENFFRRRTLFGKATSVGDGDGFHLYHTPGGRLAGWDWLRKVPESRADLKGKTISIRLAGVDAPEGPHFGRPGQPFADDAQVFLSDIILNRRVRARIYKRDQYNRVIATAFVRRFLFRKDVGLELLKKGLATTYEAKTGIEWGGREQVYKAAEAKAKSRKLGIWSVKASEFQSPRDYKAKAQGEEQTREEKQRKQKSWWRKLLGF